MKAWRWLFLMGLMVLFVLPLGVLLAYGLSAAWTFPQVIPERFSARGLVYLWRQREALGLALGSSVVYSALTALAALLICLAPAKLFARRDFAGKNLLEGLLLAPALAPAMTFSMGVHFAFIKIGLADRLLGVVAVLTVFTYPYMLRTLVNGYQSFDPAYEITARNLGAGPLSRFWRVELPLLAPAVVAGGSVVFLIAFSEYFLVFLIGGGSVPSYAGYLFPFLNSSDRQAASLLTLVFLAAPMILFVVIDLALTRLYRRKGLA
jgi:ABC-type spermidine/putrescine transport system permease subunit II